MDWNHRGKIEFGAKNTILELNNVLSWNSALFSLHVDTYSIKSFLPLQGWMPLDWTDWVRAAHWPRIGSHFWDPWLYYNYGNGLHMWTCLGKLKSWGKTLCSSASRTYYNIFLSTELTQKKTLLLSFSISLFFTFLKIECKFQRTGIHILNSFASSFYSCSQGLAEYQTFRNT